jgi:tRNA-dihydrouridine synthase B
MFDRCVIRGRSFVPARFCAPMAGYTHSAFRRLVGNLGGCGAFWTEMLAARQLLHEDFVKSPWLRRRPEEGQVFFQIMASAGDPFDRILARLQDHGVELLDLNLGCHAPHIRSQAAGSRLFEDFTQLRQVVEEMRRCWPALLTVKIRLGHLRPDWRSRFIERVRFLEDAGVDALIIHPRFFEDKLKRRPQHELLDWIRSITQLPLIANGDLTAPEQVAALAHQLRPACALMIGRMAIARPWIFSNWDQASTIDYLALWRSLLSFLEEDFPPVTALRRLKMFTKYFAANFVFGHQFNTSVANAPSLADADHRAEDFLGQSPRTLNFPSLAGL